MTTLTKAVALTVLALWSLAAMHCKLEALPGLDFLKSCCFVDAAPSAPIDCTADGCTEVEEGRYRSEERTASAPRPVLVPAALSPVPEALMPDLPARSVAPSESPPELSKAWHFALRAALPPRAPSFAS